MTSKAITHIGYWIIGIAVVITVAIQSFMAVANIFSNKEFFLLYAILYLLFLGWSILPYFVMLFSLKNNGGSSIGLVLDCLAILLVSVGGFYLIIDSMYIHRDAQGGLVFLFAPIYQIAAYAILTFLFNIVNIAKWLFAK